MDINVKLKKVADNIREARLLRNYSQDYMALKLNISQNAYSKIELGYTRLTYNRLVEIAEILNFSEQKLLPSMPMKPCRELFPCSLKATDTNSQQGR
ncbi:hypothetical protein GCM10023149_29270 [Mucilaginibacter gynuensis]|uniref:HTH cro/C1-type domain-containing protein n=1 Tax=Mucilaginibacter gynuensis TaxID=1302236 RepID=A0ABP8GL92_9SPHI